MHGSKAAERTVEIANRAHAVRPYPEGGAARARVLSEGRAQYTKGGLM